MMKRTIGKINGVFLSAMITTVFLATVTEAAPVNKHPRVRQVLARIAGAVIFSPSISLKQQCAKT